MKRGKQSEQTVAKYVGFLIELKKAVELNPQMTTSTLVKKHQVSYDTVTILKQTGTLVWIKTKGWGWRAEKRIDKRADKKADKRTDKRTDKRADKRIDKRADQNADKRTDRENRQESRQDSR